MGQGILIVVADDPVVGQEAAAASGEMYVALKKRYHDDEHFYLVEQDCSSVFTCVSCKGRFCIGCGQVGVMRPFADADRPRLECGRCAWVHVPPSAAGSRMVQLLRALVDVVGAGEARHKANGAFRVFRR